MSDKGHTSERPFSEFDGTVADRRIVQGRRDTPEDDAPSGFERRRGPGRRRSDFTRAAEEGEMTTEQFLFLMAIDDFKKANNVTYPTWTDVLEVVRLLGYRKTLPCKLKLRNAEDFQESPAAPANVRPERWAHRFDDDELDAFGDAA